MTKKQPLGHHSVCSGKRKNKEIHHKGKVSFGGNLIRKKFKGKRTSYLRRASYLENQPSGFFHFLTPLQNDRHQNRSLYKNTQQPNSSLRKGTFQLSRSQRYKQKAGLHLPRWRIVPILTFLLSTISLIIGKHTLLTRVIQTSPKNQIELESEPTGDAELWVCTFFSILQSRRGNLIFLQHTELQELIKKQYL